MMDPDVALVDLRDALAEARELADGDSNDKEIAAWQEVGERFEALDQWLTKGGFFPRDWKPTR